ncbi:MAG: PEP-CTERM sorting domain-containing protein [Planctomycetota bacterium]|nr:MAG: PEP-CTERM sorting domain-containing protein [Planctomycetota bacterium]
MSSRVGWYIDDVAIRGVPAPASAALLGLGGLVATRRRR